MVLQSIGSMAAANCDYCIVWPYMVILYTQFWYLHTPSAGYCNTFILGLLFHVKRHIVMFFLHSPCEGIPRWHDIAIPTMKGDLMGASLILSGCRCPPKCDAHAQTSFGCLAVQQDSKMYVYVICLRRFRRVYTTTYPSKSRTVRRTSTSHRVEVRFFSASSSRCTQHHP